MTRDQYFALVAACDEVLLAPDAPAGVMAVPWLHVMREHPVFLARYDAVFRPARAWRDRRDSWRQRAATERQRWRRRAVARWVLPTQSVDVLFLSHLLDREGLDAGDDFYFGSLPADVQAAGLRTSVALIDHTPDGAGQRRPGKPGRLVLRNRLDASAERGIARELGAAAKYLSGSANHLSGLPARVRQCASWFARGPEARTALRIGMQMEDLVRRLRPRLVITTHEGHSWERLAFAAARRGNPSARTAGYHATPLFPLQHALSRRLAPEHQPDVIFTAGTVTRDALALRPGLQNTPIQVLGSNRRFEAAGFDRSVVRPGCVVVPEGLSSEVRVLFRFAADAARLSPDVQWFFRLHPLMSFDEVRKDIGDLPANVVLSKRPLAEDFAACSWAFYRGSSAAIQAAAAGLRPIYVRADEPFTIDPMFDLHTWRVEVDSPRAAVAVIASDRAAGPDSLRDARAVAAGYAADYFQPLDAGILVRALESAAPS